MTRLHLDYETFSEVDIKKVGGYKYVRHPSTEVLMLGWAFDDEPVQLWQPRRQPMPSLLGDGLRDPSVNKKAFNAAFERGITEHKLGIAAPANEWTCTMVESYYLGFAGGLDKVLEAIGLQKKDPRGGQLINLFSKPAPKNHKADRYTEDNRPQEWAEFCQYCITDVEVERRLWHWLQQFPSLHWWDHQQWQLDQRINERGVLLDVDLAKSAIELWSVERGRLTKELQDMTGLAKVTRGPFLQWMEENTGVALENLSKDYLSALLNKGELPEEARPYVQLWAQKEAKAVSKYTAVINAADDDDHRARGMFQYKGASRTDRVGGRLIQLQNLKRPFVSQAGIGPLVDTIKLTDPQFLKMLYPQSVSESLGGAVRHALMAPEGRCFAVCDLTSVESVVLGWIAMCPEIDRTFREGRDSYKTFASNYFGIPYGEVTKGQRSFSKPPVLGCFAADTKILTKRGWVDIALIRDQDVLWDGLEWVAHDGVIPQGDKDVIDQHGVRATPDHKILTNDGWVEWRELAGESIARATGLVSGRWSLMSTVRGVTAACALAGRREKSRRVSSLAEGLVRVLRAQTERLPLRGLLRRSWGYPSRTTTGWPTGSTPQGPGAATLETQRGQHTGAGGSLSSSPRHPSGRDTSPRSQGGTALNSKSTESTTPVGTKKVTSDLPHAEAIPVTPASTWRYITKGAGTLLQNSIARFALDTAIKALSPRKLKPECPPLKSSRSTVPTYDVLNAGPRNRFVVLTDKGPVIAHNCGFMLGWKGLIAYAEGYGVDMDEAEARRAVDTFRGMYPEIPQFWKWIYDAVKYTTQTWQFVDGYRMHIERDADFLRIRLPSGRNLSYYKPEVVRKDAPWSTPEKPAVVDNFSYMGMNDKNQWGRIFAHAGGVTENIVQSIAGDLLWNGIRNAEGEGLEVVVHVHDEIAVECDMVDGPAALATLEECMTRQPHWATDMWIGADGFLTRRYTKD